MLIVTQNERMTVVGKGMSFNAGKNFFVIFARNASEDIGAVTLCSLAVGLISVIVCWCLGRQKTDKFD
jgi:hypothetical protein